MNHDLDDVDPRFVFDYTTWHLANVGRDGTI